MKSKDSKNTSSYCTLSLLNFSTRDFCQQLEIRNIIFLAFSCFKIIYTAFLEYIYFFYIIFLTIFIVTLFA